MWVRLSQVTVRSVADENQESETAALLSSVNFVNISNHQILLIKYSNEKKNLVCCNMQCTHRHVTSSRKRKALPIILNSFDTAIILSYS